ncbi:MAG: metalloregulator ArsR/SmtB family transcription factor [Rothia sp. (in: high G+C Gram-positive bacteria)]|nr:metalloregulator ArsR/SmtB family transcription factor [Rothia sp. (in: high G+C Gram-positive bacteria)]
MKDDVFAVIADPTRRHILQSLAVERLAVGELVEELGVSQPTVSKHLKVLRNAGLVETEAVGQKRFYSITPHPLQQVTDWVDSVCAPAAEVPAPVVSQARVETEAPAEATGEDVAGESPAPEASEVPAKDGAEQVRPELTVTPKTDAASPAQETDLTPEPESTPGAGGNENSAAEGKKQANTKPSYEPLDPLVNMDDSRAEDRGILAKLTRWGRRSSK